MTMIRLVATDQLLSIAHQPKVASGDQNSVAIHVDFDSKWDAYGKSAVFFTSKNKTAYEVILTDGECTVPHEVLAKPGNIYIGVRGVDSTNRKVKTSSLVKYKIAEGTPSGDGTTAEPTPDVYQQLLTSVNETKNYVETIVEEEIKPFSENMVVSQGKKDGWTYRQWANGMAECWTTIDNPFSADGYFSPLAIKSPTAIATFESRDDIFLTPAVFEWYSVNIADYVDLFVVLASCYDAGTLDKIPSPTGVRMHLYITGEWKDIISSGDYPVWEGGLY